MSVDDVVDLGMRIDDCLIAIYAELAEAAKSSEVKRVFLNLWEMENKEKRQLARNAPRVLDF